MFKHWQFTKYHISAMKRRKEQVKEKRLKTKFYFIHEHDKFTTLWIKSYLLALAMGAYCRTQSKWMEQRKTNTNWKKEIIHIHKLKMNNENIWKLNKSLSLLRDFTKSYSLKKLNLSLHRLKWGHKLLTKINGNDVIPK